MPSRNAIFAVFLLAATAAPAINAAPREGEGNSHVQPLNEHRGGSNGDNVSARDDLERLLSRGGKNKREPLAEVVSQGESGKPGVATPHTKATGGQSTPAGSSTTSSAPPRTSGGPPVISPRQGPPAGYGPMGPPKPYKRAADGSIIIPPLPPPLTEKDKRDIMESEQMKKIKAQMGYYGGMYAMPTPEFGAARPIAVRDPKSGKSGVRSA